MGMACLQSVKHLDLKISRCRYCGCRLKRASPNHILASSWPPPSYGTFPGFFESSWPKTDQERWDQAAHEQFSWEWPVGSPVLLSAPQALLFKSPQLRMNRHVIEPLAR